MRRSGTSAAIGFVLVIILLISGASLAFTGGGGLLSGGGRFFGSPASPSPTPARAADASPGTDLGGEVVVDLFEEPDIKASGTSFDYTCLDDAIRDLSRGRWILSDVQAGMRTEEDGTVYDQVYWKLLRSGNKKVKGGTKVTMQWVEDTKELQDRFGIGRVQGDRAILVSFNGPVEISANSTIEATQFDDEGVDQIRRVQLFEKNGRVRTAIGIKEDSCARMRSAGWAAKAKGPNARVVLDLERVYEGP